MTATRSPGDRAAFDALMRRAGLRLSAADEDEMFAAWGALHALTQRLRDPERSPMADPLPVVRLPRPNGS